MELERRALLKLGGGSAVGGLMLSAAKALGVAPKAVAPPLLNVGAQVEAQTVPSIPTPNPMQELLRQWNIAREGSWVSKQDHLDIDLRMLKSVSPAMKYHMQKVRDRHYQEVADRLHKLAYPFEHGNAVCGESQQPRGY